jgi:uncharacterized protein YgiM (DUF1202 family)
MNTITRFARALWCLGVVVVLAIATLPLDAWAQQQTAVVTRNVNLRSDPSTSQPAIELLKPPTTLEVLDPTVQSGYLNVRTSDGTEGWVWARNVNVSEAPPAPTPAPTPTPTPAPIPTPSPVGFNVACALPFTDASPRTDFDDSCPNQGQPTAHVGFTLDQVTAMYTLKNNYCAPGPAVNVDFADMGRFEQGTMQLTDGSAMAEGQRVRLVGYVAAVKTTHSNEGVNCHYTDDATTDIHINVSQSSDDECQGVVAELIPHMRPTALTHDNVKQALSGKVVRVTGQLFNDAEHHAACHQSGQPSRLSVWEVHPIYLLDICTNTTLTNCPIDDDSVWTPYLAAP